MLKYINWLLIELKIKYSKILSNFKTEIDKYSIIIINYKSNKIVK